MLRADRVAGGMDLRGRPHTACSVTARIPGPMQALVQYRRPVFTLCTRHLRSRALAGFSAAGVVPVVAIVPPENVQPAFSSLIIAPLASLDNALIDEIPGMAATGLEVSARVDAGVEQPQAFEPGRLRALDVARRAHQDGEDQDTA